MNFSWTDSAEIAGDMCSSTPGTTFFAYLYAWLEQHRSGDTYTLFNLDSNTGTGQTLTLSDSDVYPGVLMPGVVRPKLARLTVRSAFDDEVAKMASGLVGRPLPPRYVHFRPASIGGDCTRFSLETRGSFRFLSFAMDGPCHGVPAGRRVPIVYQGGSTVDQSVVRDVRCFECSSGLVSVSFRQLGRAPEPHTHPCPDFRRAVRRRRSTPRRRRIWIWSSLFLAFRR